MVKNMEHEDKVKIFIRFLKKHKIYNQFFTYASSESACHLRKINKRKINVFDFINNELNNQGYVINKAFVWDKTEEGYLYWFNINNEWEKIRYHLCRINY